MLRRRPRVASAVVTGLAGQRFLDVYIPSLGLELRIQTEEVVPPVVADWDAVARCPPWLSMALHQKTPGLFAPSFRCVWSVFTCLPGWVF